MINIEHHSNEGIFIAREEGKEIGNLEYEREGRIMTITHTRSFAPGRGLGRRLVAAAIDYAREQGMKIVPLCSFAKALMERIDEYKDLMVKENKRLCRN